MDASGAGGGAVATNVVARVLPKGHVPSAGVCWGPATHPYVTVLPRLQSCHTARQYFVTHTAFLEEFGITAEPTEENPPCKQDIKF